MPTAYPPPDPDGTEHQSLILECLCGWSGRPNECRSRAIDSEPGVIESACPECGKRVYPKR